MYTEITPYCPANWYSEMGAKKKLYQLEKKGLPSFFNWRFITLTVDPVKFQTDQEAYEYIKPRMRFFIRTLKAYLNIKDIRYIWKLEFQKNGFPHWHMLLDYKKPICAIVLTKLWDYGRIDIKRCQDNKIPYTFKYVSKNIDGLPKWFKEYKRPRLFQSSGIFPKKINNPDWSVSTENEEEVPNSSSSPETLGQRLLRYSKMIQFKGKRYSLFYANCTWDKSLFFLLGFSNVEFINPFKLVVPYSVLTQINQIIKCHHQHQMNTVSF